MNTIVTGASGIAGAHVVRALRSRGIEVVAVSRTAQQDWWKADLTSEAEVADLPAFGAVVHCAGLTPRLRLADRQPYQEANVATTVLLAREAVRRGASLFVFISTMGRPDQQADVAGRHYVDTKREAEERLIEICAGRCAVWILRAPSLYGEYDRGSMARLITLTARGWPVGLGSMRHRKCLLYAGTLGEVIAAELLSPDAKRPTSETAHDSAIYEFGAVLHAVGKALGRPARRAPAPDAVLRGSAAMLRRIAQAARIRLFVDIVASVDVALRDVPCEGPNVLERRPGDYVGLQEGVQREVEWLRAQGRL